VVEDNEEKTGETGGSTRAMSMETEIGTAHLQSLHPRKQPKARDCLSPTTARPTTSPFDRPISPSRTKYELQKLTEEEQKLEENDMLRSLLQKTMTKAPLDSMISSYYSVASKPDAMSNWQSQLLPDRSQS